jgi:hypothetical protein
VWATNVEVLSLDEAIEVESSKFGEISSPSSLGLEETILLYIEYIVVYITPCVYKSQEI